MYFYIIIYYYYYCIYYIIIYYYKNDQFLVEFLVEKNNSIRHCSLIFGAMDTGYGKYTAHTN